MQSIVKNNMRACLLAGNEVLIEGLGFHSSTNVSLTNIMHNIQYIITHCSFNQTIAPCRVPQLLQYFNVVCILAYCE